MSEALDDPVEQMMRYANMDLLVRGGARHARWEGDGGLLWTDEHENLRRWDPAESSDAVVVDGGRLARALGQVAAAQSLPSVLEILSTGNLDRPGGKFDVVIAEQTYVVDLSTYTLEAVHASEPFRGPLRLVDHLPSRPQIDHELAAPDATRYLGHDGYNLTVRGTAADTSVRLTNDGNDQVRWKPTPQAWSPTGETVVALRYDVTAINRLPLVHWTEEATPVELIPLPRVGAVLPTKTVHFIEVATGERTAIHAELGRDDDITGLGWSPNGARYFLLRTSRDLRRIDLLAAEVSTGVCAKILEERYPTMFSWADLPTLVTPVADWSQIIWRSERDGWAHLYLYGIDGTPLGRLTRGEMVVTKILAVDVATGWVYFLGQSELRPYDTHLYRVRLDGTGQTRLTQEPGVHDVLLDPACTYFLDRHSTPVRAPSASVHRSDGTTVSNLGQADITGLNTLGWTAPEEIVVTAGDGRTQLHGVIYKPANFDPSRRYPLLDWIYGGPQTTWAPKTFLDPVAVAPRALAQLGLVVVVVDARGTPGRGKQFHDVVVGSFATHVIADHLAAINQLGATRPWIDTDRVGIAGGSWGGYMTIRAMLDAPEVFKVGVANNPVVTNREGAGVIEPFLGTIDANPGAYADADLLPLAPRLTGHLLMMASPLDPLFGSTMLMAHALIQAGKDFDLVVLPDQGHASTGPAAQFMVRKRAAYLMQHLAN